MSDLWTTASADVEQEALERRLTAARLAATPVWPFLAAAVSRRDYENRLALVADRIEHVATNAAGGDPVLFGVVHSSLLDGFAEDFRILHEARVREDQRAQAAEAARRAAKAPGEWTFTYSDPSMSDGDMTLTYIGYGDTEEEARADAQASLEKEMWFRPGMAITSARKTAVETSTCSKCGAPIEKMDGVGWVDTRSGDDGGTYDICPASFDARNPDDSSGHTPTKTGAKTALTSPSDDFEAGKAAGEADKAAGKDPRVDLTTLTQNVNAPEGGGPNYWTQGYAVGYKGSGKGITHARKQAGTGPVGISQEGTGDPSRPWVVRQGETWIGAYASEEEARAAAESQGYRVISRKTAADITSDTDLTGQYVMLAEQAMKPEYRDPTWRVFLVEGGFGAEPNRMGTKVMGEYVRDGEKSFTRRPNIERIATDEEVAAARAAGGRSVSRRTAGDSTIFRVEPIMTAADGVTRSILIRTDGSVGSQDEAQARAEQEFGGPAYLSFRSSDMGELAYAFTDRQVSYASRRTAGWVRLVQEKPGSFSQTTKKCPGCGSTDSWDYLGDEKYECGNCGYKFTAKASSGWRPVSSGGSDLWMGDSYDPGMWTGSRKTAADNPFPPKKKDDSGSGNPFASKDDSKDSQSDSKDDSQQQDQATWTCPVCGSNDAYTQGGKDLSEALAAKEPIKCGNCGNIDNSGGQGGQEPPQQPPTSPAPTEQQSDKKQSMRRRASTSDEDTAAMWRSLKAATGPMQGGRWMDASDADLKVGGQAIHEAYNRGWDVTFISHATLTTGDDVRQVLGLSEGPLADKMRQVLGAAPGAYASRKTSLLEWSDGGMAGFWTAEANGKFLQTWLAPNEGVRWAVWDSGTMGDNQVEGTEADQSAARRAAESAAGVTASRKRAAGEKYHAGDIVRVIRKNTNPDDGHIFNVGDIHIVESAGVYEDQGEFLYLREPDSVLHADDVEKVGVVASKTAGAFAGPGWYIVGGDGDPYSGPFASEQDADAHLEREGDQVAYFGPEHLSSKIAAEGELTEYVAPSGKTGWSVTGPAGTYLVYESAHPNNWGIWGYDVIKSDSIRPVRTNIGLEPAKDLARGMAMREALQASRRRRPFARTARSAGWDAAKAWYLSEISDDEAAAEQFAAYDSNVPEGDMATYDEVYAQFVRKDGGQYLSVRHTAPGGGAHPPYKVQQRGDQWVVVNGKGETKGTHDSKEKARAQQSALYAATSAKHATLTEVKAWDLYQYVGKPVKDAASMGDLRILESAQRNTRPDGDFVLVKYKDFDPVAYDPDATFVYWHGGDPMFGGTNVVGSRKQAGSGWGNDVGDHKDYSGERLTGSGWWIHDGDGTAIDGPFDTQEEAEMALDGDDQVVEYLEMEGSRKRAEMNPYQPTANPYVADPPLQPGIADDQFDGPQDNPLTKTEPPKTTRPRQKPLQEPGGAPADYSVQQGFASKSMPDLLQERTR